MINKWEELSEDFDFRRSPLGVKEIKNRNTGGTRSEMANYNKPKTASLKESITKRP